jgi:YVTN family beta-propeller protein
VRAIGRRINLVASAAQAMLCFAFGGARPIYWAATRGSAARPPVGRFSINNLEMELLMKHQTLRRFACLCGAAIFLVLFPAAEVRPQENSASSAAASEILSGLKAFLAQTARPDGSFAPGIDPTYRGMSDSAYSDLAPVTYAVILHKTFGWTLPYEQQTAEFLLSRQQPNGDFFNVSGTVDPKSAEARTYNTTQGLVALHALGLSPKYNPLPTFEDILKQDYKTLPAYSTSFFPLAYLAYGRPIPPEADRRIRATMVQAADGYLNDHIAATFHAAHYYSLVGEPTPLADRIVERALADQKEDGSWFLNMPSRDRHATFDAVFTLHHLGGHRADCRRAIQKAADWALSCRNPDGGFGHYPGSTSDADANYFQIGTLVMAGVLNPASPLPRDPHLLGWGHLMPVIALAQNSKDPGRAGPPRVSDAPTSSTDRVGPLPDGRIVVPTNQVLQPAGRQITFPGRPGDVALSPDGRLLGVLSHKEVLTVDVESGKILGRAKIVGASYKGILFTRDGKELLASTSPSSRSDKKEGAIARFEVEPDGKLEAREFISLKRDAETGAGKKSATSKKKKDKDDDDDDRLLSADGVTRYGANQLPADGKTLYVAINLTNRLAEIELANNEIKREIPVGNAPFDVVLVKNKAYVSNFAGRIPAKGDTTGPAGKGPRVKVDPTRHIASEGSVSVVNLETGKVTSEIIVGLHASSLAATPDGRHVAVANANSDTVSVIDTASDKVVETISTRPSAEFPFGSSPNALVFSPDGKRLYVSNGTNNAIAVVEFMPGKSRMLGLIPTGWYPAGLVFDAPRNALYVANIKGVGSRDVGWEGKRVVKGKNVFGFNSHDHLGGLSLIPIPTADELQAHTQTVLANNRQTELISALAPPRKDVPPRPIPERHGEPSVFKHVLYIIKENRTYDQVFGDMTKGEGDPSLCIYGEEVTPNHHKLVNEFVLFDNFYCSGILSADGHQWTDEAYVTSYLEKAFGGFPRSYPYDGEDALAYASSGFLWDNVLAHKQTLRVYGEFVSASIKWKDPARKGGPGFAECYRDFIEGTNLIDIRATAAVKSIEPHLCPTFIGFPSNVPDVYRAGEFIKELKAFEEKGNFPNFMIMLLPNDHTAGTRPGMPTPEAAVADNDLALGRIVEAVSKSKFWKETCIFVVQDDPQNGFDHIDGHRTVAMVVSPYTKRGIVDSTNYNQTSMVRTIELCLGLPPMNQLDASATPMSACFTDTPDFTPYTAVPNRIPLDRLNPELADIKDPRQLHWAKASITQRLDEVDEADEDTLNRILWFAARGNDETYPAWAVLDLDDEDEEEEERERALRQPK